MRHRDSDRRGSRAGSADVVDAERTSFSFGDGLEAHDDALLFAGPNGEDACPQHAASHVLDERRVAVPPNDVLVDAARLVRRHGLAGHELAVDLELEGLERGPRRHGEDVVRFADQTAAVPKGLGHLVAKYAICELDTDLAGCALNHAGAWSWARSSFGARPGDDDPLCGERGWGRQDCYYDNRSEAHWKFLAGFHWETPGSASLAHMKPKGWQACF